MPKLKLTLPTPPPRQIKVQAFCHHCLLKLKLNFIYNVIYLSLARVLARGGQWCGKKPEYHSVPQKEESGLQPLPKFLSTQI